MPFEEPLIWLSQHEVNALCDELDKPHFSGGKLHSLPKEKKLKDGKGPLVYHWRKDVILDVLKTYKKRVIKKKPEPEVEAVAEAPVEDADDFDPIEASATPESAVGEGHAPSPVVTIAPVGHNEETPEDNAETLTGVTDKLMESAVAVEELVAKLRDLVEHPEQAFTAVAPPEPEFPLPPEATAVVLMSEPLHEGITRLVAVIVGSNKGHSLHTFRTTFEVDKDVAVMDEADNLREALENYTEARHELTVKRQRPQQAVRQ